MSYDLRCPYCDYPQDVNHDDGFGYSEDSFHKMQCYDCEKNFVFQTSISFYYEPSKADCLNGNEHNFKATVTFPRKYTMMSCTDCDLRRSPTEEELSIILIED